MKFNFDSYSVTEGEEAEVCVVFEAELLKKDVRLTVVSHSDTANIGEDYSMLAMLPLTLNPGTNHSCFAVDIVEDSLVEGDETFQLILTSTDQAILTSTTHTVTVYIEDNDSELASRCHDVYANITTSIFICSVATFGLDAAVYTVTESDDLIVPVYLLENELAIPVSLEIKTFDISAS